MAGMTPLHRLAQAVGLQPEWEDADSRPQRVADANLLAILDRLGFPATSDAAADQGIARLERQRAAAPLVTGTIGQSVRLPGMPWPSSAELLLEGGARRDVTIADNLLPSIDVPGYHRLVAGGRDLIVAIAPRRCFAPPPPSIGRRRWGAAVQVAALRDDRATPFGDFRTLAAAARSFAAAGADALAISPTHALFPADPGRYSPYAPSSRQFTNILYADPTLVGAPPAEVGRAEAGDLIDWAAAIPERLRQLRRAFSDLPPGAAGELTAWTAQAGAALEDHARFDALHAHFFAANGTTAWQGWPQAFHDPRGAAVAAFAAERADEVRFFAFLQWLATRSLTAAQAAARDGGMAIGLIADLAVGMDPGGSHGWSRPDDLLSGLSIGAPPDPLGPQGQNWGITGLSPLAMQAEGFGAFIATLRTAMNLGGGLRIDHALGLRRLWVVPEGGTSADGAYLTMPFEDMLRLIALESHRACAVVVGEDLGTVPPGFRDTMAEAGMLGMAVLPFERDSDGFTPPGAWRPGAVAMTGTHDTATLAGWWRGRDLEWAERLGRIAPDEVADKRAERDADRDALWTAASAAGLAEGTLPPPDAPAAAVDAAIALVTTTPTPLAIVPLEDLLALEEQPNLPGTIDEHPNWRRRMPGDTAALLATPAVAGRVATLNTSRTA